MGTPAHFRTQLDSGVAYFTVPAILSLQDVADLKEWMAINLRSIERRAILAVASEPQANDAHGVVPNELKVSLPPSPIKPGNETTDD